MRRFRAVGTILCQTVVNKRRKKLSRSRSPATFCLVIVTLFSFGSSISCSQYFSVETDSVLPYAYALTSNHFADALCATLYFAAKFNKIRNRLVNARVMGYAGSSNWVWVGARQTSSLVEPGGNWFWIDGSLPNGTEYDPRYFLWAPGSPSDTVLQNCALLRSVNGLNDGNCGFAFNVFCQVNRKILLVLLAILTCLFCSSKLHRHLFSRNVPELLWKFVSLCAVSIWFFFQQKQFANL
jgi:hypothetical protein